MNALEMFGALLKSPLELMKLARGLSAQELERVVPEKAAASLAALTKVYAEPVVFSRKQADCVKGIGENEHSLDTLEVIESLAQRVAGHSKKWQLRQGLCREKGTPSEIKEIGLKLVKTLRKPRTVQVGVSIRRYTDQTWSMRVNGPAALIAELYDPIKDADDPASALHQAVTGGEAVRTVLRPVVTIPLDAADKVLDGTGDETVLLCSDGVERTSTEVAKLALDEEWGFALIHPVEGPVDLVRSKRLANDKQRILAKVENPTCPWDNCHKPADECEVHHIIPWQLGGHTSSRNLTTCCAYHNGVNDDDPNAPPSRGRLERINGRIRRVYRAP